MKRDDKHLDEDLRRLVDRLPDGLRGDWVVVPRRTVTVVFLTGVLMGAAAALYIAGKILDVPQLDWALGGVFVFLVLACRCWSWWNDDHFVKQLREVMSRESDPRRGAEVESR